MQQRKISAVEVSAIGLGAMPLSVAGHMPDEEHAMRAIHAALDAGVTLIDTADAYTPDPDLVGHNERLIATALASYPGDVSDVLVATKGGHTRTRRGWGLDGSPKHLRSACDASLKALGIDAIGLYQFHRPDPKVPFAESVGALAELLDAGKIRMAGISNANEVQIRVAQEVLNGRLASVQNQFSPRFRSSEPELQLCTEMGVAFLPWSPLGGIGQAVALGTRRYAAFAELAVIHGVSPQRLCLAWLLAQSPVVIPIPGASRPQTIRDSVAAVDLVLSPEELARLS